MPESFGHTTQAKERFSARYVNALAACGVMHFADLELEATIDNAGARVYNVLAVVFTMPTDPPPMVDDATSIDGRLAATTAAELLGLAARLHVNPTGDLAALADRVIACAVALGGHTRS